MSGLCRSRRRRYGDRRACNVCNGPGRRRARDGGRHGWRRRPGAFRRFRRGNPWRRWRRQCPCRCGRGGYRFRGPGRGRRGNGFRWSGRCRCGSRRRRWWRWPCGYGRSRRTGARRKLGRQAERRLRRRRRRRQQGRYRPPRRLRSALRSQHARQRRFGPEFIEHAQIDDNTGSACSRRIHVNLLLSSGNINRRERSNRKKADFPQT